MKNPNLLEHLGKDLTPVQKMPRQALLHTLTHWMVKSAEMNEALPDEDKEQFLSVESAFACASSLVELLYMAQTGDGGIMYVSKQVSDDLLRSDIPDPDFASLVWPMDMLEIRFEDPEIPTTVFNRNGLAPFLWAYEQLGIPVPEEHRVMERITLMFSDSEKDMTCRLVNDFALLDKLASGDLESLKENEEMLLHAALRPGQGRAVSQLLLLLFKVLMFAATPKFSPKVRTRSFPKAPRGYLRRSPVKEYTVEYLPHHITEKKAEADKCGTSHAFKGRRGHWRTYASERYINKQGSRDYIYPVPNPHGDDVKRKFIVRKP